MVNFHYFLREAKTILSHLLPLQQYRYNELAPLQTIPSLHGSGLTHLCASLCWHWNGFA